MLNDHTYNSNPNVCILYHHMISSTSSLLCRWLITQRINIIHLRHFRHKYRRGQGWVQWKAMILSSTRVLKQWYEDLSFVTHTSSPSPPPSSPLSPSVESGMELNTAVTNEAIDLQAAFSTESSKAAMKIPVIHGEVLNISLKEFAALFIVENAPYSYKKWVVVIIIIMIELLLSFPFFSTPSL